MYVDNGGGDPTRRILPPTSPTKNVLLLLTRQETFAMLANGALNGSVNCPTSLQTMPGSNGMKSGLNVVK